MKLKPLTSWFNALPINCNTHSSTSRVTQKHLFLVVLANQTIDFSTCLTISLKEAKTLVTVDPSCGIVRIEYDSDAILTNGALHIITTKLGMQYLYAGYVGASNSTTFDLSVSQ